MDWLHLLANLIITFEHWGGSLQTLLSSITAQFTQLVATFLAAGNAGHPVQDPAGPTSLGATPELDSLMLFGTGLLGAGGYALTRLRARR